MTQHPLPSASRFAAVALVALAINVGSANAQTLTSGIDTTNFDRSVRSQDDFFRFVNGGWLRKTEIPGDATGVGAFQELSDRSRNGLHTLFEEAALARELKAIGQLKSAAQLAPAFAHFARLGVVGPIGVGVGQDAKASSVNIVTVNQAGLGLPDRDYYLRNDAKTVAAREAYVSYLTKMFSLAGQADAAGAAQRVLALETAIAGKQWDRVKSRDRDLSYNRMSVAQLAATMPSYDWKAYLRAASLSKGQDVIVRQPDYLTAVDTIIKTTPASTWREYLPAKLLDATADELPAAFVQARFAFRGRTLSGQQEQAPRWKRAVSGTESVLGDATGKLYVERFFKPEAKVRMDALVKNLRNAYAVGIDSLEWMSPATKAAAKEKLAHFTVKIGYPDKPRDYAKLEIRRGDLVGNTMRARLFQYKDMASRLRHAG